MKYCTSTVQYSQELQVFSWLVSLTRCPLFQELGLNPPPPLSRGRSRSAERHCWGTIKLSFNGTSVRPQRLPSLEKLCGDDQIRDHWPDAWLLKCRRARWSEEKWYRDRGSNTRPQELLPGVLTTELRCRGAAARRLQRRLVALRSADRVQGNLYPVRRRRMARLREKWKRDHH